MSVAPPNITTHYEEVIPGVYQGVPNQVYHESEGISCSDIKELAKSIEHYEHRKEYPQGQTDAMLVGSALHDIVLLPNTYKNTYVVAPVKGKTTKAYRKCIVDNPGKDVLTQYQEENILNMRDSIYRNPTMRGILESDTILRESSIWVRHGSTGLVLKIRPDIIVDGVIYDLKTTSGDVSPRGFINSVFKYKYHIQAPFYVDCATMNGMTISGFKFLVVGSVPPYSTAIYDLNADTMEEGRDIYRLALYRYGNYLVGDNIWKGLVHGRETVTL